MSSIGSFGTFTTARLAIYVSQKGLTVTGNNIANINTVGYTRQRLDQVSFKTGMADRIQNPYDTRVGNGAIAKSVSQLRDPYLDIRYRAEHSSEGYYDGKLSGLDQIADILDEIGDGKDSNGVEGNGLLHAQFNDFLSALQHIQVGAGEQINDTLASTSAEKLCQLFYNAASQLERLHTNTEVQLRQEINDINGILVSIRKLNEAIQQAEIYGDGALELRDERNNFIDALSEKLKIDATYSMVDIGGQQVEKLTIRLANANPDKTVESDSSILVDGDFCAQLTTPKDNLDKDGNPVFIPAYEIFDKNSTAYENAVKDLANKKPVANPDAQNVNFTTQKELDDYIDVFMAQSNNKMAPYRFVDENGEGTNDPRDAAQVFDDNYNITVSDLRDKNNKAWVDYPGTRNTFVKDDTGFPTKAELTGSFKIIGGEWKDGDTININVDGTDYNIKVGEDLTADAANQDPKNISNAIRKALLKNKNLADNYDVTTRTIRVTGGFNVDLTVKAKEPGLKNAEPVIAISTPAGGNVQPAGNVSFTPATPGETNPPTDPKSYTTKVSVSPAAGQTAAFHEGDIITIGAVKLEVGSNISVNAANDPKRLATKLAAMLSDDKFTVTAKDDVLTFKAKAGVTDAPAELTATAASAKPAELEAFTKNKWKPGSDTGNDKNGNPVNLKPDPEIVDNGDNTVSKVTTRYYMDENDKWHQRVKTVNTSKTKQLDDNDLFGRLQSVRELLTEEGEFSSQADIDRDESAAIKRGIPYYQEALDLLARQFATVMNEANNGYAVDEKGNYLAKNGSKIELAGEVLNKQSLTDGQKTALINAGFVQKDKAGNPVLDADGKPTADPTEWLKNMEDPAKGDKAIWKMGGNLFSNRGDTDDATGITALNISVSQSWSSGAVHVVPTYIKLFGGGTSNTTQQDNALHMGSLMDKDLVYNPQDLMGDALSSHLFEGSFQEMFQEMSTTLGTDQNKTKVSLSTHTGQALDIDTSRDSVSAVDLNDEAMDLMQYTHSLNAAYRLMTTLDEMLERLITGTGVTR